MVSPSSKMPRLEQRQQTDPFRAPGIGARGPQGETGRIQQRQGVLDLENGRVTILYEQQTAENLGEYFFQADPEEYTLERY